MGGLSRLRDDGVWGQIRHYTGSQHTYVLTSMFSFHDIMSRFSRVMTGILPEDWGEREAMYWAHES